MKVKVYDYYRNMNKVTTGTVPEIAEETGLTKQKLWRMRKSPKRIQPNQYNRIEHYLVPVDEKERNHVIAKKSRVNHEVYNDIDGIVVNFIMQAIEHPKRLAEHCAKLPYSREVYEKWRREELPADPFERAVRFFYLNRSAISKGNSEEVPKTGWRHSTSSSQNPAKGYINACEMINGFSRRMQGVMIENMDYKTMIEKYDGDNVFFYVDPPYIGREKLYAGGFTLEDHKELAETLKKIKGKAMVSYYEDPLINEMYPGWNIERHDAFKQAVGGQNVGGQAEELLIMNYQSNQLSLF